MSKTLDRVVRSMTPDGAFRVITAVSTRTVQDAVRAQNAAGSEARALGELITGAILVREAMSPDRRVQVLLKDPRGRTRMVADAHPDGWNRGIVNPRSDDEVAGSESTVLEVLYTLPNGILHQGMVSLPEHGGISAGLMAYLQNSEQIASIIAVATVSAGQDEPDRAAGDAGDGDTAGRAAVVAAGGYMIQLMPDAPRSALAEMTEQIERSGELSRLLAGADVSASSLRDALLGAIPADRMAETLLCFGCNCSHQRVLASLGCVADSELDDMIAADKALEITCDSCRRTYRVTVAELRALRREAGRSAGNGPRN